MNCLQCDKELVGKQRKFCSRGHKNAYNQKHRYNYEYSKKYRSSSPEKFMKQLLSYGTRREFLDSDFLNELYKKQRGLCAISGVEMTYEQRGGRCPSNISLDRIDSSKGYTKDNVQLVCHIVNTMKMQYSVKELVFWCTKIVENS
jgi:hypothetical protein